jgi:pyridoxine 5-phosphate synthase
MFRFIRNWLWYSKFGAEGITIHPRPDERHIRYQDTRDLKERDFKYNIEGNQKTFIDLVFGNKTDTSDFGADAIDANF